MDTGIRPRLALGLLLGGVTALLVWLLGGGINAALVALVGATGAVLLAAGDADAAAERRPPSNGGDDGFGVQAVIDAIDGPVLVVAGGRIACANPAACALLGSHIVGEDVRLAIRHPAAAERLLGPSERVGSAPVDLAGLGSIDQHWQMRVAAIGERRVVQLIDRTASRAAERMRVDFVANASHELRTPLASLLGFVETLQEEAGDDPAVRNRFLKVMFDEARRMQRLIDDLISLSRIEAARYREPADAVDFTALTREVCDTLATTRAPRGDDLALELADVPAVRGDASQLSQLLFNIIGNALKYGREGTPVRVAISDSDGMLRLMVADQGEGIAAEHLPRLTERFYRVDSGRSRALGGTGLGLAIVKHVVERHRGRLDIVSTPGEGTSVSVLLPLADTVIKS